MKARFLVCALLLAAPVAAQPAIAPATVHVVNSPNALTWPVTTRIQRLEIADAGVRVTFDRCGVWPDVTPPGWAGPLRFTLWLFESIGGEWYASGIIQFWACDQFNGGAIFADEQIARNWVYDGRWSSMVRHQPAAGERIAFMVSAGNARGQDDHLVQERSDIVEIAMPSGPAAPSFLAMEGFLAQQPAPPVVVTAPTPTAQTPPAAAPLPVTVTVPPADLSPLYARFDRLDAKLEEIKADLDAHRAAVKSKFDAVVESPYFKYALMAIGGWLAHLKLGATTPAPTGGAQ